jgi:hypothetical protein
MTRSDCPAVFVCARGFVALVLLVPVGARASGGDEAGARVLFAEGRKLADAGNYAEACPKFEESLRLDDGAGTSFNLADCLEHLGHTASAWTRFLDVAATTKAAGQLEREQVSRARAANLEPTLSRLVIEVSAPAPGLVVERDGVSVGAASFGVSIPVDPGEHLVLVRAPGKQPWSQATTVPSGPVSIVVSVPELVALPPEPAPPPARGGASVQVTDTPAVPAERPVLPALALAALGAAGIATGAVFAVQMSSANNEAKGLCPNSTCANDAEKTRHDSLVESAHSDRTVAIAAAGLGAAALGAAAVLWWRPFASSSAKSVTAPVAITSRLRPLAVELEMAW